MAFNGTLEIDNKQYTMLEWNIHIIQQTDREGRPKANPGGGKIMITLESDSTNDLFDWAVNPNMTKSGKIVFLSRDNSGSLKTFDFKKGYCVNYFENFSSEGKSPMKTRICISAMEIKNGNAQLKKNWMKANKN